MRRCATNACVFVNAIHNVRQRVSCDWIMSLKQREFRLETVAPPELPGRAAADQSVE
jgi:hypothetical protein